MTRDEFGSYPAAPEGPNNANVASPEESAPAPKRAAIALAIFAGIIIVGLAGGWYYYRSTAPVSTPSIVSLTPAAAEAVLRDAHLTSGKAMYRVTRSFASGHIIAQTPNPYVLRPPGSPVNVEVAVAPKAVVVPDVVGADSDYAQSVLRYALFTPTVIYAYSRLVRTGSVIEQLPRAGDSAITGTPDVLVVSLGVGVSSSHAPALIGKTFAQASIVASDSRLFVQPRPVVATGTPDGIIVDQAPSAGTTLPAGSNVWVSVADSRAKP